MAVEAGSLKLKVKGQKRRPHTQNRRVAHPLVGLGGGGLRGNARLKPIRNDLQNLGSEGFFDGTVLGGRAGVGVLEKMIEIGELADFGLGVAGVGERLLEKR